jgi:hypothetical protein
MGLLQTHREIFGQEHIPNGLEHVVAFEKVGEELGAIS